MFLYNIKLNGKRIVKFMFIVMLIVILIIFSIGVYNIFFKHEKETNDNTLTLTDTIKSDEIYEITPEIYTTVLDTVTNNLDSYVGCNIHFTGYVYRLIDFDENQFVLARDMLLNENTKQSLVVGFLCTYDKAYEFPDDTWVDITGTIVKGDYYGEIAEIKVTNIFECQKPENKYVPMPDDTYIPTANMF